MFVFALYKQFQLVNLVCYNNEFIATCYVIWYSEWNAYNILQGRRGRDRMVVGFTTTYAISAYHHRCCEFESRSGRGVQHYVIKFVNDLRQVSGFIRVIRFPPPKLTAMI
jgi:hypothetical protein